MSESVSGVDVILAGLEERARREPYRGCVSLLDAEAAVHATVREIEAWLRELPQYVITIQDREGYTYERGSAGQPMNYTGIMLEDAERFVEAAVHATAQKYEAALARQGAMLDRCRDERLSWEDVQRHSEAAVHATVREIEAWLRENIVGLGLGDDPYRSGWLDAADEVARRFGGTT